MLGAPAGRSRRPLLLLLLLARPLWRLEAGPGLRSAPPELRRGGEAPPSARGAPRPGPSAQPVRQRRRGGGSQRLDATKAAVGGPPSPAPTAVSQLGSVPRRGGGRGGREGNCWFLPAAGSNPERRPSPGPRLSLLRQRPPFWIPAPHTEADTR